MLFSRYFRKGGYFRLKLRLSLAILAGKITAWVSRFYGHKGSSLPGVVARRIYHGALRDLAAQVGRGVLVISGTNGKTTTTNMIVKILGDAGYKVTSNLEGANLITGVTASLIKDAGIWGKLNCDYAVLEVDEASMPGVLREVNAGVVVLTNFFRDQLDRYWELDKITGIIHDALHKQKQATLILNADDPLVAQFQKTTSVPALFYGLGANDQSARTGAQTRDGKFCPFCGAALDYRFFHYSQLGLYSCPGCEFSRPVPQVEAFEPKVEGGQTRCRLVYDGREVELAVQVQGLYNLYNALAAFSVGLHLGLDSGPALDSLGRYRPVTGRMEVFNYKGKLAYLNLVKNPTGFNEGLATLCAAKGSKDVFIAINDNDADGRDVSWLWDVDFEMLGEDHRLFNSFVCCGLRGEEMAVRLKYAGVPINKVSINANMHQAIKSALAGSAGAAYLFSTYTALWPAQKMIKKLAVEGGAAR
jgi:UDP-N-acetylmuramyl tripeptide synthase